jgi:hypothetical protein
MSANNFTHLLLQHWFDYDCLPALFVFLIRLPYWRLTHCFKYTSSFYTPEKPRVNPAFRGSTYSYVPENISLPHPTTKVNS